MSERQGARSSHEGGRTGELSAILVSVRFGCVVKNLVMSLTFCCVVQESVQLADGLTLVKQYDTPAAISEPRFMPGMSTEDKLDTLLRTKFEQLMNTHTVSMDLTEGRGRGMNNLKIRII